MNQKITENLDIQEFTIKLEEAIQKPCKETSGNGNSATKGEREDRSMVDERVDNIAEKDKCLKEKVSTDNMQ